MEKNAHIHTGKKILIRTVGKNLLKEIIPEYSSMNLKSLVLTLNISMLEVRGKKSFLFEKKPKNQTTKQSPSKTPGATIPLA